VRFEMATLTETPGNLIGGRLMNFIDLFRDL
jgi:hypothetical protein